MLLPLNSSKLLGGFPYKVGRLSRSLQMEGHGVLINGLTNYELGLFHPTYTRWAQSHQL